MNSPRFSRLLSSPLLLIGLLAVAPMRACNSNGEGVAAIISPDQDKQLGAQVAQQIEADPKVKVLDPAKYTTAYGHLNRIVNTILNSGKVTHKSDFDWRLRIIQDDKTLNAFCAPGGYIYVYSGIIKFLKHEDDLAGVLGHEIAHADKRHVVQQMVKQYGVQTLLDVALGQNQNVLTQIGQQLVGLSFSRADETEADETSVTYLCATQYKANGCASFFLQLLSKGDAGNTPEFLSTHPSPKNRVPDINNTAAKMGCDTTRRIGDQNWQQFQASLP